MRREQTFCYTLEDLVKALGWPEDTVIISVYTQSSSGIDRQICFKVSCKEEDLKRFLEEREKKSEEVTK